MLDLQDGKTYIDGCGDVIKVAYEYPGLVYCFKGSNGKCYDCDGHNSGEYSYDDLVSEESK